MAHQETSQPHAPSETKQTDEQQAFDFEIQPASSFLRLPAEIRNKIYELAFSWNQDNIDPFDTKRLQPLLACKQVYTEAHVAAFTSTWYRIRIRLNAPSTRARDLPPPLRPPLRKLIHRLWLDFGSATSGRPEWHVTWTLAALDEIAGALGGAPVAALHIGGLQCLSCRAAWWHTRDSPLTSVGQHLAVGLLALARAWPTLKEVWIGLQCALPYQPRGRGGYDDVRDGLLRAVVDSSLPNFRAQKIPALRALGVLDDEWVRWADGWVPVVFGRPALPVVDGGIGGVQLRRGPGAPEEGRVVEIVFAYLSLEPDRYSRELLTMRRKYSILDRWEEDTMS